jgi:hypothetical protein
MEEEGEVLGTQQCDGRVWAVWSHGPPLHPPTGFHPQVCQGWHHGLLCPMASWYETNVLSAAGFTLHAYSQIFSTFYFPTCDCGLCPSSFREEAKHTISYLISSFHQMK